MREFERKFGEDFVATLPLEPGVYQFHDENGQVVYVGKAKRLRRRLEQYRAAGRRKKHRRMRAIIRSASSLTWETCATHLDACLREIRLIQTLKPKHNVAGAFHHRYPYVGVGANAVGGVRLVLTSLIPVEGDDTPPLFGAFRSREVTVEAFFSLARLARFIGHQEKKRRALAKPQRGAYDLCFRRLPVDWVEDWQRFFRGESIEALRRLSLSLLDRPDARARAAEVEDELKALRRFWREEAAPLAQAINSTGYTGRYPIAQDERDPIFIRLRLMGPLDRNSNGEDEGEAQIS